MKRKVWCMDPQSGGQKIPAVEHAKLMEQAKSYAQTRPWNSRYELRLRFKNQFCYLDAMEEKEEAFPIGRLRYILALIVGAWLFIRTAMNVMSRVIFDPGNGMVP